MVSMNPGNEMHRLLSPSFNSSCPSFEVCVRQEECWDADDPSSHTASCWILIFILFTFGLLFIMIAEIAPRNKNFSIANNYQKFQNRRRRRQKARLDRQSGLRSFYSEPEPAFAFVESRRTLDNFVRSNTHPALFLPNRYEPEYTPFETVGSFYPVSGFFPAKHVAHFFYASVMSGSILLGSSGLALVIGSFSSFLWLAINYEDACSENTDPNALADWVNEVGSAFQTLASDYKFYPIFLLVGYIAFIVSRWREFMVNCHTIQARIHDIALLAGSSPIPPVQLPVRKKLFTIYRYLNLTHALCYKSVSPTLSSLDLETDFADSDMLGLLTEEELARLLPMDNKVRDTVIGWLSTEIAGYLRMDGVDGSYPSVSISSAVAGLRGSMARHHGT